MSVSSTSSTPNSSAVVTSQAPTTNSAAAAASAVSTNSIDVASIVAQLMTIENQPLVELQSKITTNQTQISDLGTMKSNVLALQSALTTFESPSTYNNPAASTGDSTVVTATATTNAAIGSVSVLVSQIAKASSYTVTKSVATATDTVKFQDMVSGDTVTVNGLSYTNSTGATLPAGNVAALFNDAGIAAGNAGATGYSGTWSTAYSATTTTSGNVLTLTASTPGLAGNAVNTSGLATEANFVAGTPAKNYTSATDTVTLDPINGFQVTVGSTTYSTNNSATPIQSTGSGGTVITLTDLRNWINGLGANVSASIIQTTSASDWVLQVNGTQTGLANAVSINSGTGNGAPTSTSIATAQDAIATIGGLIVDRSSNIISDVVNGLTLNLVGQTTGSTPTSITVAQGADNSSVMINTLITAYNAVITQYNSLTANNANSSAPGDFANNPTMLSFANNIKQMFAYGATDPTTASLMGFTTTSDQVNLDSTNGYLQIGTTKYKFSSIGNAKPTASEFMSWVNGLNAGVTANFQTTTNGSTTSSSIVLKNTNSSAKLAIDLSGMNNSLQRTTTSLSAMGMDLQIDGTIQFNTTHYQSAVASGLYSKLSSGLKIGYSGASSNLDNFLNAEVDPASGVMLTEISAQQSTVTKMQSEATTLQAHLNQVQINYVTQYSTLNSLLFQLNSTSTSLANALTAVTNINAGK